MSVECNRCGQDVSKQFASLLDSADERIDGCPLCGVDLPDDRPDDDDLDPHDFDDNDDDDDPDPPLVGVGIDDLLSTQSQLEANS